MNCAGCRIKKCYLEGKDCTEKKEACTKIYETPANKAIMKAAEEVEAEGYANLTRIEELILFSKKMEYRKLGIAFCVGCAPEAKALQEILENHFETESVCCKICGIDKTAIGFKTIREGKHETVCNPVGQAVLLNEAKTDLNVVVGLCLGHDILFAQNAAAPVTTLVVKDRVLVNNPAGALYSPYWKYKLMNPSKK